MPRNTGTSTVPTRLGDYQLLEKIAEGGVCTIYRGHNLNTGEMVAIKVLPAGAARRGVSFRRFEQEFRAANRLDHPNIVRALDFCGSHTTPYLVMELVDGQSVGEILDRQDRIREDEAIQIIVEVCQGLGYAHELGVIHRDIKPDNILITRSGQTKLADLGLAKELLVDNDLTRTGRGLGTPYYMAPEQFRDAKHIDARADIYSLGATLYHMVTGETPFACTSPMEAWMKKVRNELPAPRQILPTLSANLEKALLRAMSNDPNLRPASCTAFARNLTSKVLTPRPTAMPIDFYLCYQDSSGQEYAVKQPLPTILQMVKKGVLANARHVVASRSPDGPYLPLNQIPELRQALEADAPQKPSPQPGPLSDLPTTYRNTPLIDSPSVRVPRGVDDTGLPARTLPKPTPPETLPPRPRPPVSPRGTPPTLRGGSPLRPTADSQPAPWTAPAPAPLPAEAPPQQPTSPDKFVAVSRPAPPPGFPSRPVPTSPRPGEIYAPPPATRGSVWQWVWPMLLGAGIALVAGYFFR
jgi:serine/threonine protein kinase